jgi:hypothetical protein
MTSTATRCGAALFGALAFTAASWPSAQVRTAPAQDIQVSQYCVPQEPTFDAHRFYCGNQQTPVSMPEEASFQPT